MTTSMPDGRAATPPAALSAAHTVAGPPSGALGIKVIDRGLGTVVLTVSGDIDLATIDRLARTLLSAIESDTSRDVLVDLHDVYFLGAAGIGVLAQAQHRATERGVTMRLERISRVARRALEITGVTGYFDHWPTRTGSASTWTG